MTVIISENNYTVEIADSPSVIVNHTEYTLEISAPGPQGAAGADGGGAIGDDVTGGTSGSVLYVDSNGKLAQEA